MANKRKTAVWPRGLVLCFMPNVSWCLCSPSVSQRKQARVLRHRCRRRYHRPNGVAAHSLPPQTPNLCGAAHSLPPQTPSLCGAADSVPPQTPNLCGAAHSLPPQTPSLCGAAHSLPPQTPNLCGAAHSVPPQTPNLCGAAHSLPPQTPSLVVTIISPALKPIISSAMLRELSHVPLH